MNKKNAAMLLTRLLALGGLGTIVVLALIYVPGAWELLTFGAILATIPMMFMMTVGIIEISTFESLNLITRLSKSDVVQAYYNPENSAEPEPEPA